MNSLPSTGRAEWLRWFVLQISLTIGYYLAAKLGLSLAFAHSNVSPVWPPTGLALGAVLVFGYRVWPAIALGVIALTAWGEVQLPWFIMLLVAGGNVLEAITGAWLIRNLAGHQNVLHDARTYLCFLGAGVFACTTISSTVGVTSLCFGGVAAWDQFGPLWLTWWLGDGVGALILAPFVVSVFTSKIAWPSRRSVVKGFLIISMLTLIFLLILVGPLTYQERSYPPAVFLIPPLAWMAFQYPPLATTLAVLLVSIAGIWATVSGSGPLGGEDLNNSLLMTQTTFGLIAGTTLLLAALRNEQRGIVQQLTAEQDLLRQLIELQEQERKLVAHDIHDGMVQDVVVAHMLVQSMQDQVSDSATPLSSVSRILQKSIDEGRRLIREMQPLVLDEAGVIEAVQHLIADVEKYGGLVVSFDYDVQFGRLKPRLEGVIFRIIQESLKNVEKHAHTDHAAVILVQSENVLTITVGDNGRGFDPDSVPQDRFGVRGIYERARLLGGFARIDSHPGSGTQVYVQMPLDS